MSRGAEIPFIIVTSICIFIGVIIPIILALIPKLPDKGVAIIFLAESAFCCWLFWVVVILMQVNPLLGPQLGNTTIVIMQHEWNYTNSYFGGL